MGALNPMADLYKAEPKQNNNEQVRESHTNDVDIKYGIKAMRVLAVIIYALAGIAVLSLFVVSVKENDGYIFLAAIGGGIIPISIGLILRKVADIAEYISDKVK